MARSSTHLGGTYALEAGGARRSPGSTSCSPAAVLENARRWSARPWPSSARSSTRWSRSATSAASARWACLEFRSATGTPSSPRPPSSTPSTGGPAARRPGDQRAGQAAVPDAAAPDHGARALRVVVPSGRGRRPRGRRGPPPRSVADWSRAAGLRRNCFWWLAGPWAACTFESPVSPGRGDACCLAFLRSRASRNRRFDVVLGRVGVGRVGVRRVTAGFDVGLAMGCSRRSSIAAGGPGSRLHLAMRRAGVTAGSQARADVDVHPRASRRVTSPPTATYTRGRPGRVTSPRRPRRGRPEGGPW